MTYIIAEIGINYQGDVNLFKKMMVAAKRCGVDAVKGQKRTPKLCYSEEQYNKPYTSPLSSFTTYGEVKEDLELSHDEWRDLMEFSRVLGLPLFASVCDILSARFMRDIGVEVIKIASCNLTDTPLLKEVAAYGLPVILSTGMSTLDEIDTAVDVLKDTELTLMHCTSCYPCDYKDINLLMIPELIKRYGLPVGFSGHHVSVAPDAVAVAFGACMVERHFTLDRAMKGTDHAASLEPVGMERVVKYIRVTELALGTSQKKVLDCELSAKAKLRGYLK